MGNWHHTVPETGDRGISVIDKPLHAKLEGALPKQAPAEKLSRKQREIQILEEARNLLADKGYAKFSMRGVAAANGVSLRTVQHYFPAKKDLLLETVKYTLAHYYDEQIHLLFAELKAKEPVDRFQIVMDYMLGRLAKPVYTAVFHRIVGPFRAGQRCRHRNGCHVHFAPAKFRGTHQGAEPRLVGEKSQASRNHGIYAHRRYVLFNWRRQTLARGISGNRGRD